MSRSPMITRKMVDDFILSADLRDLINSRRVAIEYLESEAEIQKVQSEIDKILLVVRLLVDD